MLLIVVRVVSVGDWIHSSAHHSTSAALATGAASAPSRVLVVPWRLSSEDCRCLESHVPLALSVRLCREAMSAVSAVSHPCQPCLTRGSLVLGVCQPCHPCQSCQPCQPCHPCQLGSAVSHPCQPCLTHVSCVSCVSASRSQPRVSAVSAVCQPC